jgi:hypothetical protein
MSDQPDSKFFGKLIRSGFWTISSVTFRRSLSPAAGLSGRQQGKFGRRLAIESHVRPTLVVVPPPGFDDRFGFLQSFKPMQVQLLISERSIDEAFLCFAPGASRMLSQSLRVGISGHVQ